MQGLRRGGACVKFLTCVVSELLTLLKTPKRDYKRWKGRGQHSVCSRAFLVSSRKHLRPKKKKKQLSTVSVCLDNITFFPDKFRIDSIQMETFSSMEILNTMQAWNSDLATHTAKEKKLIFRSKLVKYGVCVCEGVCMCVCGDGTRWTDGPLWLLTPASCCSAPPYLFSFLLPLISPHFFAFSPPLCSLQRFSLYLLFVLLL